MKTKPLVLFTLALLPSFFTPANADLKDGLVAHWSFDDCTAKDNSGNGHDGTINGNPQCVDAVRGKAFSFDGKSDYVLVPNADELNMTQQMSFGAWVNLVDVTGRSDDDIIINKEGDSTKSVPYELAIHDNTGLSVCKPDSITTYNFSFYIGVGHESHQCGWANGGQTVQKNTWTFLFVTYDGTKVKTYFNGKLVKTYPTTKYISTTSQPLLIGARGGDGQKTDFFNGSIDNVSIYNRALSESEVTELYKNPTETFKPSYTLSQPLDSIFNATDGSEQMDGTVFGQCVYGGYCARPTQKGALNGVNYMVDSGTPVYAICDGVVKNVTKGGDIKTRYTAIDHSNCGDVKGGLFAYYRHIDPAQNIKKGALIKAGDLIGTVATWKNNSHLQLSLATKFLSNLTGYTELKTITKVDCSKTAVEQRRKTLNDAGWLDPIEIGMKSGWNSVLLKGGISKTGCNATEQLYEPAPLGNTLPYSPWK